MGYPMHIDTISMELSIWYFKGLSVKLSIKWHISVPVLFLSHQLYIHIETTSKKLSIFYFKGLLVKILLNAVFLSLKIVLNLSKQWRPWWNAALCGISSESALFAKYLLTRNPEWIGLMGKQCRLSWELPSASQLSGVTNKAILQR